MNTETKLFTKVALQRLLKQLRHEGFYVEKLNSGYAVYMSKLAGDRRVLLAMVGSRGYLVRYDQELLTEAI